MTNSLIKWDIYEISTEHFPITGMMVRGRIRKFCLQNNINVLAENTEDLDKQVRFAIITNENPQPLIDFIKKIIPDSSVKLVRENVPNPILSKLKVNIESRYKI